MALIEGNSLEQIEIFWDVLYFATAEFKEAGEQSYLYLHLCLPLVRDGDVIVLNVFEQVPSEGEHKPEENRAFPKQVLIHDYLVVLHRIALQYLLVIGVVLHEVAVNHVGLLQLVNGIVYFQDVESQQLVVEVHEGDYLCQLAILFHSHLQTGPVSHAFFIDYQLYFADILVGYAVVNLLKGVLVDIVVDYHNFEIAVVLVEERSQQVLSCILFRRPCSVDHSTEGYLVLNVTQMVFISKKGILLPLFPLLIGLKIVWSDHIELLEREVSIVGEFRLLTKKVRSLFVVLLFAIDVLLVVEDHLVKFIQLLEVGLLLVENLTDSLLNLDLLFGYL